MTLHKRLLVLAALLLLPSTAHAVKISSLPAGTALVGTEIAPFVQSGATVQISADQLATFVSTVMVAATHTWALDQSVPDEVYSASNWNGSLEVPTKNAVRDVIEGVVSTGVTDGDRGDITVSGVGTVWDIDSDVTILGSLPVFTLQGNSNGAIGPIFRCFHDSATPAAADVSCAFQVLGGANDEVIGRMEYYLLDGTNGSEDGMWQHYVDVAGADTLRLAVGTSVVVGNIGEGNVPGVPMQEWLHNGTVNPIFQVQGAGATGAPTTNASSIGLSRGSNDNQGPLVMIAKSRSTTGTYTILQDGDSIGEFIFMGSDGADYEQGVNLFAEIDGTPGTDDMPSRFGIQTTPPGSFTPVTRFHIARDGQVIVADAGETESGAGFVSGMQGWSSTGVTPNFQVIGDEASEGAFAGFTSVNSVAGAVMLLGKSRGGATLNYTPVASGDFVGLIGFQGADGTDMAEGAIIYAQVDGTPSSDDMPMSLIFGTTPDGTPSSVIRMRIDENGGIVVGNGTTTQGRGTLTIADAVPVSAAGGQLLIAEDTSNGANYKGLRAPATVTANTDCLFEDDANFIPDSCVGDGSDASDARLKTGFRLAKDTGPLIDKIKVYDFEWNVDAPEVAEMVRKGKPGFGVKAQELYEVAPDLVHVGGDDAVKDPWTWKPEKMVPYLIVEIQRLRERVAELEAHK